MVGCEVTVSVTATTCAVAKLAPIVTVPVYLPAASPVVFTETLADPGVVPGLTGAATSHEPPAVVAVTAVKANPA